MECGECTACCCAFEIKEADSAEKEQCQYAMKGCQIYAVRPLVCRIYECAWLTQPKVGVDLRPDRCGAIFTKMENNVILVTPVRKLEPVAQRQIEEFKKQGYVIRYGSA